MTRVSLEEQYNNKDVITQILKMRDDIARIAANAAGIQDITLTTTATGWKFTFILTDGTSYVFPLDTTGYITDAELATALADYYTTTQIDDAFADYYTKTEADTLLSAKANDAAVVKLQGVQTIHDVKTMDGSDGDLRVRTTPPDTASAVNSAYVNDATDGINNIVHKSGGEIITGPKEIKNLLTVTRGTWATALKIHVTPFTWTPGDPSSVYELPYIQWVDDNDTLLGYAFFKLEGDGSTGFYVGTYNTSGTLITTKLA